MDKFKKMARKVQLDYLKRLDDADIEGVGPKFEEAVLSAAVQYSDLGELASLLDMSGKQKVNVSLLQPSFARNNLEVTKLCQIAMRAIVIDRMVPLVSSGEDSKDDVVQLAMTLRAVASVNAEASESLVLSGFLSELDLIACTVLGVLGKPMVGVTAAEALTKVTSLIKDSGKEGYKFIFRKALEQSAYWKGEVAKYMESAVAAATLLPEVNALQKQLLGSLERLKKDEALEQLRCSVKRLPLFRTSLQSKFLSELETQIGELCWLLLGEESGVRDVEETLTSVSQVMDDYLALPVPEGDDLRASIARVEEAKKHCQEMLQEMKVAKVEQCVRAALEPFKGSTVSVAEWKALGQEVLSPELLNNEAKAALDEKLRFLVSSLGAELTGEARKEVLESAFHTLKRLPPALPDEEGKVIAEIVGIGRLFEDLLQARGPLQDVEKVFEKRDQREMRLKVGQLVQKLSACQALSPQLQNAQLFCQSLQKVQVETEKVLKHLQEEFKTKYEAVFSRCVENASSLVTRHATWKEGLMGPRDSVVWKVLLKSAAHLLDPKAENGTVEIMDIHSEFIKERSSFRCVLWKEWKSLLSCPCH